MGLLIVLKLSKLLLLTHYTQDHISLYAKSFVFSLMKADPLVLHSTKPVITHWCLKTRTQSVSEFRERSVIVSGAISVPCLSGVQGFDVSWLHTNRSGIFEGVKGVLPSGNVLSK